MKKMLSLLTMLVFCVSIFANNTNIYVVDNDTQNDLVQNATDGDEAESGDRKKSATDSDEAESGDRTKSATDGDEAESGDRKKS
jgi:uncharacterized protein YxeA